MLIDALTGSKAIEKAALIFTHYFCTLAFTGFGTNIHWIWYQLSSEHRTEPVPAQKTIILCFLAEVAKPKSLVNFTKLLAAELSCEAAVNNC